MKRLCSVNKTKFKLCCLQMLCDSTTTRFVTVELARGDDLHQETLTHHCERANQMFSLARCGS